jgi:surface protein
MKKLNQYINEKLVLTKKQKYYTFFPKTKEELVEIIKSEVEKNGWECDLNHIDVSEITDMSYLFSMAYHGYGLAKFNGDISEWDVSNVKNMTSMFDDSKFNRDISKWNVSNVTTMEDMFNCAQSFNQPIGDWDVSNVTDMNGMFSNAQSFNQPIGDWDISNVKDMSCMFNYAYSFNRDLSKWKPKANCDIINIFYDCPIKEEYKPKFN